MSDASKRFSKSFGRIFRLEQHTVEARRRRYRIERILGFLPQPPEPLPEPPDWDPASPGAVVSGEGAPGELEEMWQTVRAARAYLEKCRRPSPNEEPREAEARYNKAADAARNYYLTAKTWYEMAREHLHGLSHPPAEAYERAEAILRAAAKELADAVVEARRESALPDVESSGGHGCEEVSRLYGVVLYCEVSALQSLGALGLATEDLGKEEDQVARRSRTQPASRELWGIWLELREVEQRLALEGADRLWKLARAEKELFEAAARLFTTTTCRDEDRRQACQAAAAAAEEEVQRRWRDWDEARRSHPELSLPPGAGGGTPPMNPCLPGTTPVPPDSGTGPAAAAPPDYSPGPEGPADGPLALSRQEALDMDLVGLALSGGGIRSATFGLGVLQGLASLRLLGMFDYLSTVSGGGYIGSWLAAWVFREGSLPNVERQLSPNRLSQAGATRYGPDGRPLDTQPRDAEPEPVHHLRAYSRYLSPRFGLFAPDTWTLGAIYLRNLFINTLFFLPLAVAVVFGWRLLLHGFDVSLGPDLPDAGWNWSAFLTARFFLTAYVSVAFVVGVLALTWQEENLFESDLSARLRDGQADSPWFTHLLILFPMLVIGVIGPWIFNTDPYDPKHLRYFGESRRFHWFQSLPDFLQFALSFSVLALLLTLVVRLGRWIWRLRVLKQELTLPGWRLLLQGLWELDFSVWKALLHGLWKTVNFRGFFANVLLAAAFGTLAGLVLRFVIWPLSSPLSPLPWPESHCLLNALGLPLVFGSMVLSGWVEMAVLGYWLTEYEREWRSRVGAYLLMGATAWLVFAGAVYLLPFAGEILFGLMKRYTGRYSPEVLKATLTAAWAVVSGAGAWIAQRDTSTGNAHRSPWWARALITVAPLVFLVGLVTLVSVVGQEIVSALDPQVSSPPAGGSHYLYRAATGLRASLLLVGVSFLIFLLFGYLIPVNRFSMHMLYANRLTRCYLGASRRKPGRGSQGTPTGVGASRPVRQANFFTGFDPWDDFPLAYLRTVGGTNSYTGPVPLINCALNCLAGDELAYQDRRADPFLVTPDWCGGLLTGYARTPDREADRHNLTLGRVLTISGAAVDPNMNGLSPPLTALMTLFNTRLGWWLENPNPTQRPTFKLGRHWTASEPGLGLRLLWEFLGWTNERSPFVHVSDGGHFENLGVYELIRRRCRFIVVVDAGTDPGAASDNMAAMLRLVRTDFGISVELDPSRLQLEGDQARSPWHACVGRVRYDEVDERAVPGLMVYLQATLTGDEPPDLLQYVSRHPHFPRQSTLNQFFDEAQFEAYRTLGHHTAVQVFGESAAAWTGTAPSPSKHRAEIREVFAHLRKQWIPPLDCSTAEWVTAAQGALQLEQGFSTNANLVPFGHRLYPEVNGGVSPAKSPATARPPLDALADFRAVSQTLQVMETAWAAMKLDDFHAHPINRGWMNTFRRWTSSPDFQRWWPVLRGEYSSPFVRFCEDILNLQQTSESLDWCPLGPPVTDVVVELDQQFAQEWGDLLRRQTLPVQSFPPGGLLTAALSPLQIVVSPFGNHLAWLIGRKQTGRTWFACGLAYVARTPRLHLLVRDVTNTDAEFLLWLRGSYRSMGIGREAAESVLHTIDRECAFPFPAGLPIRRLFTYYPLREATSGYQLELERWTNFFFDLGFRRRRQPERGIASQFILLERAVG